MRTQRNKDDGFSLIEALVAMTVLSVSAGALLTAVEEHTRAVTAYSERATARWVAENRLAELRLGLSSLDDVVEAGGRQWRIALARTDTPDPDLVRVDISVGPLADRDATLARLTGFLDRAGTST
ncbi:MAG: type II secretion system minor pseudopilin GspI [Pseudomonadota bacterium]